MCRPRRTRADRNSSLWKSAAIATLRRPLRHSLSGGFKHRPLPTGSICHRKDNGDDRCCLPYRGDSATDGDNYVDLHPHELGGNFGVTLGAAVRPTILDREVTVLDPARSRRCATKAAVHGLKAEASAPRNPMVGSFPACCARATSGQVAAVPPSAAKNFRRPM